MDIMLYISDLLTKNGFIVVPGLGTFSKSRTEGYYNKELQRFFPPVNHLHFKAEVHDDDTLAHFISSDRNISSASARYFIEKYVSGLLELAESENARFGNFGYFNIKRNQLIFTPTEETQGNEQFYGLEPVILKRTTSFKLAEVTPPAPEPVIESYKAPEPVIEHYNEPKPKPEPAVIEAPAYKAAPTVQDQLPQEFKITTENKPKIPVAVTPIPDSEEDENAEVEPRRKISALLVLSIIIVTMGIALIVTYRFYPSVMDRMVDFYSTHIVKGKNPHPAQSPAVTPSPDSSAAMKAGNKTSGTGVYKVVLTRVFPNDQQASEALSYYISKLGMRKLGIIQKPGTDQWMILVGTYNRADSAGAAMDTAIHRYNFSPKDLNILQEHIKKP